MRRLNLKFRKIVKPLFLVSLLFTFLFSANIATVYALNPEDLHSIYNDTPWYRTSGQPNNCLPAVPGSGNDVTIWNYLITEVGLTETQAAAFMGNFQHESGFEPRKNNGGALTDSPIPGKAYGIAQWKGGRTDRLVKRAADAGVIPGDLMLQLELVKYELGISPYDNDVMNNPDFQGSLDEATRVVFEEYEIAGDGSLPGRQIFAQQNYDKFARGNAGPTVPTTEDGCCAINDVTAGEQPNFIDLSGPPTNGTQMGHGPFTNGIKTLVIHYTQGNIEGSALKDFFMRQGQGLGVQFSIGATGKVYNYFPLDAMQVTWHAMGVNSHAIGIEISGVDGEALINNATQFNAVVQTVEYLCDRYNIPCADPKGDITNSSAEEAQGLIGHSEAPTNDHSDPDTKIVDGRQINIVTNRPWTEADRHDASKHAYMLKLRQALGFTEGGGGGCTGEPGEVPSGDYAQLLEQLKSLTSPSCPARDPKNICFAKSNDAEGILSGNGRVQRIHTKACNAFDPATDGSSLQIHEDVLRSLIYIARGGFNIRVSSMVGTHCKESRPGHVSRHWTGNAFDIDAVNGVVLGNSSSTPGEPVALARFINNMPRGVYPRQLITAGYDGVNFYQPLINLSIPRNYYSADTNGDHLNHLHVGY